MKSLEAVSQMPQQDAGEAEQDEADEVLDVPLVPQIDAAVVLQPREQALDLPASSVSAKHPTVLRLGSLPVLAVRRDHLDLPLLAEPRVERVAVISAVANKAIG